jgi:cobalt transporter subunit CbtB
MLERGEPSMASDRSATVDQSAAAVASTGVLLQALAAAALGLFLLWGVGFSQIEAVHNAAHDTRHSNAFPCH